MASDPLGISAQAIFDTMLSICGPSSSNDGAVVSDPPAVSSRAISPVLDVEHLRLDCTLGGAVVISSCVFLEIRYLGAMAYRIQRNFRQGSCFFIDDDSVAERLIVVGDLANASVDRRGDSGVFVIVDRSKGNERHTMLHDSRCKFRDAVIAFLSVHVRRS